MKKILAVFMAILMVFTALSVTVYADDTSEETTTSIRYPDEEPSTGIVDDDGLVVPENPTQLGFAFFFKIIEKAINFILGIFGVNLDKSISGGVSDAGKWLDEAISNIFGSLED